MDPVVREPVFAAAQGRLHSTVAIICACAVGQRKDLLRGWVQKNEATHKLYRRWMSALLESSQAHLEAKEEVPTAFTS